MGYYKDVWTACRKKQTIGLINKLLTGNITVAQAHAEREMIVAYFNELGEELESLNRERQMAERELIITQEKLKKMIKN